MKPIDRQELLSSREYWMVKMQSDLIRELEAFMAAHGMNRAQLADYLGFSRGYITQLLSGSFDSKISKIVELSLAIGLAPEIRFTALAPAKEPSLSNTEKMVADDAFLIPAVAK